MAIRSVNPGTGELIEEFRPHTAEEVERKIGLGWAAFLRHRDTSYSDRAVGMVAAADLLEAQKRELAMIMVEEMGKPVAAAISEVEKCAWACRFYADHAEGMLQDQIVQTDAAQSYVRYAPLGPVLAIMPWNFPLWQVFRFAAPALMAGNVGLLKHASNVPGCALAIERIFREAGYEEGVFQTLLVESEAVAAILDDPRVRAATLTGSTGAGSAVAERAGKRIKKTVLELGGSDPFIVMPSADLDGAVRTAVNARTINNGQSCIAAKRFIIHEAVYDTFVSEFVKGLGALRIGDPMDESTQVGPLATPAILDEVEDQVRRSVEGGATLLLGGERLMRSGNFFPPTALADIPEGSPARVEEIFGPVASLFRVADTKEAIELANDTVFGLGSSVWTHDEDEQAELIEGIDAGMVFVNAMVASDPRLPFGGVKQSGFGRELGEWGIREFVNVQTVWVGGRKSAKAE